MSARTVLVAATMVAPASLSALACSGSGPGDSGFGGGPTSMPELGSSSSSSSSTGAGESTSSAGSTTDASTSGDESETSTGVLLPDFGLPGPEGCRGKVDFLFVISTQGSMAPYQKRILTIFPVFFEALAGEFADFDVHIMVVETDAGWLMDDCSLCGEGCNKNGTLPTCGAELDECDSMMGAGVTFPAGKDSSAKRCSLVNGRYITPDDPDPIGAFECVAKVGSDGGDATPADAMVAAVSPPLLGIHGYPPGCNQGFLRDDALLVVTILSDTYDDISSGPAEAWVDALTAAKGGDPDAHQVLVITTDVDTVPHICGDYSPDINRLRTFVELLPAGHGLIGSICEGDYAQFFEAALDAVIERCEAYVPQ